MSLVKRTGSVDSQPGAGYPVVVSGGAAPKPKAQLRAHKKSRNGCLQCKRRKVKCDEKGPRCHNCKYRRMTCSFQADHVDLTEEVTDARLSTRRGSSGSPSGALSRSRQGRSPGMGSSLIHGHAPMPIIAPGTYSLKDLELMHHYATITSAFLADYDAYRPVWQMVVPQEAQAHEFLMRCILAFSALHISHIRRVGSSGSYLEQREILSYHELAQRYYNHAVSTFNSTVKCITQGNTTAVFAFSHITIFFAFGSTSPALPPSAQTCQQQDSLEPPIDTLLSVTTLLRKSMAVLHSAWSLLEESSMAVLLQRGPQITDQKYLPGDLRDALDRLDTLVRRESIDLAPDAREIYTSAVNTLTASFVMAETKRRDWSMALRFAILMPETLLEYVRDREPLALVILAHFCVLLHRAPGRWWAEGCGARVVGDVWEWFGESGRERWREGIEWCVKAVGLPGTQGTV